MQVSTNAQRYTLRALEPEDLELLYSIENDDSIWKIGASNVPYSKYVLRDYIANSHNDIYMDGQVRLMIENEPKEAIGLVDLINFNPTHNRAELAIVLIEPYRYQGIGQAVVKEICRYADEILHLNQIYAIVDKNNQPCLQCLQSIGFEEGAVLKRWLYTDKAYTDALLLQYFL